MQNQGKALHRLVVLNVKLLDKTQLVEKKMNGLNGFLPSAKAHAKQACMSSKLPSKRRPKISLDGLARCKKTVISCAVEKGS